MLTTPKYNHPPVRVPQHKVSFFLLALISGQPWIRKCMLRSCIVTIYTAFIGKVALYLLTLHHYSVRD